MLNIHCYCGQELTVMPEGALFRSFVCPDHMDVIVTQDNLIISMQIFYQNNVYSFNGLKNKSFLKLATDKENPIALDMNYIDSTNIWEANKIIEKIINLKYFL